MHRHIFLLFIAALVLSISDAHATEDKVEILCEHVSKDKTDPVGAEYVPNVDVYGNTVTAADVDADSSAKIYNPVIIPIEIDLAARYGVSLPIGGEIKPTVADIKIFQNGHVQYNGKDISGKVRTLCQNYHRQNKKIQSDQAEQHGHESHHPVLSSDKIEGQYPDDAKMHPKYND
ncbi:MAG: hypothetical protein ACTHOO_07470 [Alcanivorax sp.]